MTELKDVIVRCKSEIEGLRNHIARLEPKAEAYDQLKIILSLLPKKSQGYGEDIVWMLDNRLKELEEKELTK